MGQVWTVVAGWQSIQTNETVSVQELFSVQTRCSSESIAISKKTQMALGNSLRDWVTCIRGTSVRHLCCNGVLGAAQCARQYVTELVTPGQPLFFCDADLQGSTTILGVFSVWQRRVINANHQNDADSGSASGCDQESGTTLRYGPCGLHVARAAMIASSPEDGCTELQDIAGNFMTVSCCDVLLRLWVPRVLLTPSCGVRFELLCAG